MAEDLTTALRATLGLSRNAYLLLSIIFNLFEELGSIPT